jgi:hypothetical protein
VSRKAPLDKQLCHVRTSTIGVAIGHLNQVREVYMRDWKATDTTEVECHRAWRDLKQ